MWSPCFFQTSSRVRVTTQRATVRGSRNAVQLQRYVFQPLCTWPFPVHCTGKQRGSYFGNEAIKRLQNEHSPLVNRHMAMSFACLWISNLRGDFLQMKFSTPCGLCFKHSKQTNKSVLGNEFFFFFLPPLPPPTPLFYLLSNDLRQTDSAYKGHCLTCFKKREKTSRLSY